MKTFTIDIRSLGPIPLRYYRGWTIVFNIDTETFSSPLLCLYGYSNTKDLERAIDVSIAHRNGWTENERNRLEIMATGNKSIENKPLFPNLTEQQNAVISLAKRLGFIIGNDGPLTLRAAKQYLIDGAYCLTPEILREIDKIN